MTPVRLVAIDVDGTLLTSDHRVTGRTRAAIDRVRSRGVEVLLATSRGPRALAPVIRELGHTAPAAFVGCQGAITGSYDAGLVLTVAEQHPAPVSAAHDLVRAALDVGYSVHWFTGPHWFVSHIDATVELEARAVNAQPEVRDLHAETEGPDKIMLISPTDDVSTLSGLRERLPSGLTAHVSHPRFLEITRSGVDKGWGVGRYCRGRGIRPSEIMAIGDGPNDLGLFAIAGRSIAPANAHPDVLAAATATTSSNDENGVAEALDLHVP